jgi:hypothetical protein
MQKLLQETVWTLQVISSLSMNAKQ